MATTYTWTFEWFEKDANDVVTKVIGDLVGENEGETFVAPFTTTLGPSDPSAFVAFEDLTDEIVSAWVAAEMGGEKLRSLKAYIDQGLAQKVAPTAVTVTPPWVPAPADPAPLEAPEETPEGESGT